jgi:adenosylmethionine-8-amino-7-oxononanoate aminotransferase
MKHLINSQLICADYEKDYPLIEKGNGVYLYDNNGTEYIDVSGCTAAVTHVGHGIEEISKALYDQSNKLAVHPTHLFYNEELEQYLKNLCDFAPKGFNHAWTICGGTEAVENAIKLAYQYQKTKGHNRTRVLARWGSYHGNSLTTLDVGGLKVRRDYYTDLMVGHHHISHCLPYRKEEGQSDQQYEDLLINEFVETLDKNSDIFCFLAEPFVGAALGAAGPTANYFKRISEICKERDILLISDEVMTGFGRTGLKFGMDHFGNYADILCCAKGISSGYFPLGAVIAKDGVYETLKSSKQPFFSGQTYTCNPLAAAVGNATLDYIKKHNLVENSKNVGQYLKTQLELLKEIPCVGDVRGEGLFLAIEFVKNQDTKEVLEPSLGFNKLVEKNALNHGLITYGCRGTVEYSKGDHMLFAPPLTLSNAQADKIFTGMKAAITESYESIR